MIAIISLFYGSFYFLFFKKLKLFAENARNISIFVGVGVVMIGAVVYAWWTFAPTASDGRVVEYVIAIVPNVKGVVVEVPIEGAQLVDKSDILFKIDPAPYQFKVNQLRASIEQAEAHKKLTKVEVKRATSLVRASAGSQSQLDTWIAEFESVEAAIASLNAQLADAQWQLDETVVRAPYEGYVYNLQLRPGSYVTSVPMASSVAFVSSEVHPVLTSFSQSAIRYINIGDAAEMVFRSKPGKVYGGKVTRIVPGSGSAQLSASSQLITMTGEPENSRWAVLIDFDDPAEAAEMPQSAGASIVAIYTQKGKPVHIISKVTLRISALMGFLTSP